MIEGTMKAGQIRYWWENPKDPGVDSAAQGDDHLAPIYSMAAHTDAVWTLTGSMVSYVLSYLFAPLIK